MKYFLIINGYDYRHYICEILRYNNEYSNLYWLESECSNIWVMPTISWAAMEEGEYIPHGDDLSDFNVARGYAGPILSSRAWNVISELIDCSVEGLPAYGPKDQTLMVLHIITPTSCLDLAASKYESYSDGKTLSIKEYVIDEAETKGRHIFRLPNNQGSKLIVDEIFKRRMEECGLTGVIFKPLRMPGDPPPKSNLTQNLPPRVVNFDLDAYMTDEFRSYLATLEDRIRAEPDLTNDEFNEVRETFGLYDRNRLIRTNFEMRNIKSLWFNWQNEDDFWPDDLLIIGVNAGGDVYCISVSGEFSGVREYDHERSLLVDYAPDLEAYYMKSMDELRKYRDS